MKKLRNKILSAVLVLSLLLTSSSFAFAVGEEEMIEGDLIQIPRTQLSIEGFSSEQDNDESHEGPAINAIDGQASTFWHTIWSGRDSTTGLSANQDSDKYIIIDLGNIVYLKEFTLLPRQTGGAPDVRIYNYSVYTATTLNGDGTPNFSDAATKTGHFDDNGDKQTVTFEESVLTRYIKIKSDDPISGTGARKYATIAELEFFMDASLNPTITEQPQSAVYGPGTEIKELTVSAKAADGSDDVSYQWHEMVMGKNGEYIDTEIVGDTSSTCTPTVEIGIPKYYYVVVTDNKTHATVHSDIVTVAQHAGTDMVAIAGGRFYNTFTEAVNGAYAGGTVWVLKNFTLSNNVNISKEITIRTIESAEEPATITRGNNFNGIMFTVTATGNLTLDDIIIDGGAVWGDGNTAATAKSNDGIKGGALVKIENNGALTVNAGATLRNNENISSAGGAISADASNDNTRSVIHIYGKILNNKTTGNGSNNQWNNGGGIASDGDLYIYEGAVISGNFAPKNGDSGVGGGIQTFQKGSLYFYGGTVKENKAGSSDNISFGSGTGAYPRGVQLKGNVNLETININNGVPMDVIGDLSGSINVIMGENNADGTTIAVVNNEVNATDVLSVFKVSEKTVYRDGNNIKYGTASSYQQDLVSEKSVVANPDGSASTTLTVETTGTDVTYKWYSCDADGENSQLVEDQTNNTLTLDNLTIGSTYYYCVIDNGDESTAKPKTSTICEVKVTDFYPCSKAIDKFKNI